MLFKYHIGTKVLFGRGCVGENMGELGKYGKRAFIVTGKASAKASGALEDIVNSLKELNIEYFIFDDIENNPSLENVKEAGKAAAEFKADFITGIGGGSPLDAAKAVAVLAVNNIEPEDLFKNSFDKAPLPVIAVPTTAGTGSEVTPYSILTRRDMQTKMSFGNDDTFPKVAFIDPSYTESLPYNVTVNTAVDAFTHALEGYLSRRSTPVSDIYAEEAIGIFGSCINNLIYDKIDFNVREKLLYMSMLGGMVISHTGTTIIHGMGYSLTYFKDLEHGRANGILVKEYLSYNYEHSKDKVDRTLKLLGVNSIYEIGEIMNELLPVDINITEDEIKLYASLAMKQRSTGFNIRSVKEEDMVEIYRNSLGVSMTSKHLPSTEDCI